MTGPILKLEQLDLMIKNGQSGIVRLELAKIKRSDLSRSDLVEYADIARRVQRPELIVRWLRNVVRPEQPVHPAASVRELAIYALGLSRLGVFEEAVEILRNLPDGDQPQVLYYLGLVYIEQWDYASALIPLRKYVRRLDITEYQRSVGLLNLAACFVSEKMWPQAARSLERLLMLTAGEDRKLLRANTLELKAQSLIFQNQIEPAFTCLAKAQEVLGKDNIQYEFFVRKWKAIARVVVDPLDQGDLIQIREEASKVRAWETVRECDFFRANALRDDLLFLKVYFGSHSRSYRNRILRHYRWQGVLPLQHNIEIVKKSDDASIVHLNPATMNLPVLVRGLFGLILSDLYRPFSLSEAYAKIYPNEYFNPETSIAKVEKLVERLRSFLKIEGLPVDLKIEEGRIVISFATSVVVQARRKAPSALQTSNSKENARRQKLLEIFEDRVFTSHQAEKHLDLSERSVRRLLQRGVADRWLQKRSLRYYRFRNLGSAA